MGKPKRERSLAENEAQAVARNLRVSPQKLNLVAGLIRGKKVEQALADLEFSRKRIAQDVRKSGVLWVLEDAQGPALFVSITRPELLFMPCWSERGHAEARVAGAWSHMRPLEVSLDSFVGLTLPWLALRGWLVGPEHWAGPGALEVAPGDLKARLVTRPVAA